VSEPPLLLSATPCLWVSRSITVPDNATSSTSTTTSPQSQATAPDKQPDGQSGLSTSVKVGIATAIVGIVLGLLGGLGIQFWRKRKSKRRTIKTVLDAEDGETLYLRSTDAPNGGFMSTFCTIGLRSNHIHSISWHFAICDERFYSA
jgi:hypothetical protein